MAGSFPWAPRSSSTWCLHMGSPACQFQRSGTSYTVGVPRRRELGRGSVTISDLALGITWHHFHVPYQGQQSQRPAGLKGRGRGLHLLIEEWQGPGRACGRGNSAAATFGKCSLLQSPNQSLAYGVGGKPRDSGNSGVLVGPLA